MKRLIRKSLLIFGLTFLPLFILRLSYGYLQYPSGNAAQDLYQAARQTGFGVRNYASAQMKVKSGALTQVIDQKYEKVAAIAARTHAFARDEQTLRAAILKHNALIQYEHAEGLPGRRTLQLAVGVPPASFDRLVEEIRRIATVTSISVNKFDKTNEYKGLVAKRDSLQKTREALASLKSRGGTVDEFIVLENRLLELEQEIQGLGVNLGEYDAENEFCTINYSLAEQARVAGIPLHQRLMVALQWTVKCYAVFVFSILGILLVILVLLAILDKVKALQNLVQKVAANADRGKTGV